MRYITLPHQLCNLFRYGKTTDVAQLELIEDLTLLDNVDFVQDRTCHQRNSNRYILLRFPSYGVNYFLFIDNFEVIERNVIEHQDIENASSNIMLYLTQQTKYINPTMITK